MIRQDPPITVTFCDFETLDELPFELHPNQHIREIYELFDEYEVKEPETYYLAHNGQVLHKDWMIKHANIHNGARIDICPRRFINVTFQGSNVTFNGATEIGAEISTDAFVGDIKDKLSFLINKKPRDVHIYWNNQELKYSSTLLSLGISTDTTMTVQSTERITIYVSFIGTTMMLQLSPTATIQDIFDILVASLGDTNVERALATFGGFDCTPCQTLQELGVMPMDRIDVEVYIPGS